MKKIITFIALAILTFTITGCFSFEEVSWMEFVDSFDSVYEMDATIDLSKIKVRVGFTDGKIQEFAANSSELTVSGVNTETAGIKTVRITYRTLSVTAQYEVVQTTGLPGVLKVTNEADFATAINNTEIHTIYLEGDITNTSNKTYEVSRQLTITGLNGAKITGATFELRKEIGSGIVKFKNLNIKSFKVGVGTGINVSKVDHNSYKLHIDGCEISDYEMGLMIDYESFNATTSAVINDMNIISEVKVTNSFFNNNALKGLSIADANNIIITGTTFNSNATNAQTRPPVACEINLKFKTYNSVLVENCRFVGNGTEYLPEGYDGGGDYTISAFTAALAIKARNDAPSYGGDVPSATLKNVVVRNNQFESNLYAIYFGEPLSFKDTSTEPDTIYAVAGTGILNNVVLYGNVFENNIHANIINATTNTSIISEVLSVEGLRDAIIYSADIPGITIHNYTGIEPDYEAYRTRALGSKDLGDPRSFNVTVINK